jgi:hypothetical protein
MVSLTVGQRRQGFVDTPSIKQPAHPAEIVTIGCSFGEPVSVNEKTIIRNGKVNFDRKSAEEQRAGQQRKRVPFGRENSVI